MNNPTAAPAAMKDSARAGSVIAAPVKVEQRLLKVCVRRTPLERAWRIKRFGFRFINLLPAVQDDTCIALKKIN